MVVYFLKLVVGIRAKFTKLFSKLLNISSDIITRNDSINLYYLFFGNRQKSIVNIIKFDTCVHERRNTDAVLDRPLTHFEQTVPADFAHFAFFNGTGHVTFLFIFWFVSAHISYHSFSVVIFKFSGSGYLTLL